MRDANQYLGLGLREDESYTTIAGFLMARAGRVLKSGDSVEDEGGVFTVERTDGLRIRRVRFTPAAGDGGESRRAVAALLPFAGAAQQVVTQAGAETTACVRRAQGRTPSTPCLPPPSVATA